MAEWTGTQSLPKTTADYKAAIERLLVEMLQSEAQMQQDRTEIERLRAKSQAITRHTDAVLARLNEQIEALGRAT